ncbi:MAG TPA: choice-of-anchor D domain-containing protein [Candidatus Dormibacteraeota bacterium]
MGISRLALPRSAIGRAFRALVAATLAVPTIGVPAAAPVSAAGPISVVSSSQWSESLGALRGIHFVGQIQNVSGGTVAMVRINVAWTDSTAGTVTNTSTIATRAVLANNDVSPFDDTEFFPSTDTVSAAVTSISAPSTGTTPYYLDASMIACPAGDPADYVCGVVSNTSTKNGALQAVDGVTVMLTYAISGTTVGTDHWEIGNDLGKTVFNPGDTGHFEFARSDGHASVTVLAADAEPSYPLLLDPQTLDVGPVNIGKSGHQDVTLTNSGSLPITLGSLRAQPGEFSASTDCPPGGIAAGAFCHVTITFAPTASDAPNARIYGTLTITDAAAGSPNTVVISGTPTAPVVSLSPSPLDFGNSHRPGPVALIKRATLTNIGTGPLTISSVAVDETADFSVASNFCPMATDALQPGAQCPIDVSFSPGIAGPYGNLPNTNVPSANLVVTDDAGTGTQKLPLTAIAAGPGASFRLGSQPISSLSFGQSVKGVASAPLTVTLLNNGTETVTISSLTVNGDYSQINTCGAVPFQIAAGGQCTIILTFTPSALGSRPGSLVITDNAGSGSQSLALSGTGVNPTGIGRRTGFGVYRWWIRPATH